MEPEQRQIGKITAVSGGLATVRVERQDACAGCAAKEACHPAGCPALEFHIATDGLTVRPGDEVWVVTGTRDGMRALTLAYIVPLFWMMLCFLVPYLCGSSELLCALVALASLAPYYLFLHLYEKREARAPLRLELVNS